MHIKISEGVQLLKRHTLCCGLFCRIGWIRSRNAGLLADAELLLSDDCAVTVDVLANQVVEKAAALAYKHL